MVRVVFENRTDRVPPRAMSVVTTAVPAALLAGRHGESAAGASKPRLSRLFGTVPVVHAVRTTVAANFGVPSARNSPNRYCAGIADTDELPGIAPSSKSLSVHGDTEPTPASAAARNTRAR